MGKLNFGGGLFSRVSGENWDENMSLGDDNIVDWDDIPDDCDEILGLR